MTFTADRIATHGWKFCISTQTDGDRLIAKTPTVIAHCKHGNRPPVPRCPCGIHFVDGFTDFYAQAKPMIDINDKVRIATFGMATGPVIEDLNAGESWGGQRPWRSSGYKILGILTEPDIPDWRVLERIYNVPVLTNGINPHQARLLESRVRR